MSKLLEFIDNFLRTDGWPSTRVEDEAMIQTAFEGENGQWVCLFRAVEDQQQVVLYSYLPLDVPEEKLTEVTEYLTRVNYGLIMGNFEIDLDDGEVRYKTSLDVENTILTPDLLRAMVMNNLANMDKYLPGFEAVISDNQAPVEALEFIEDQYVDEDEDE